LLVARARGRGEHAVLATRRRWHFLIAVQSVSFAVVVLTGVLSMRSHGWTLAYPRWLALKVGIVLFLFVPLECFLAYVGWGWVRPGLESPSSSRALERGASMQGMVWAIALPLLGLALPVVVWLSVWRPF
jgi:hypothetical protein